MSHQKAVKKTLFINFLVTWRTNFLMSEVYFWLSVELCQMLLETMLNGMLYCYFLSWHLMQVNLCLICGYHWIDFYLCYIYCFFYSCTINHKGELIHVAFIREGQDLFLMGFPHSRFILHFSNDIFLNFHSQKLIVPSCLNVHVYKNLCALFMECSRKCFRVPLAFCEIVMKEIQRLLKVLFCSVVRYVILSRNIKIILTLPS